VWGDVDLVNSSILEIYFPVDTIVIKRPITDELGGSEPIGYQAIVLDPRPECTAQLLALAVDHIDILLEDWYPTLGECWRMYNAEWTNSKFIINFVWFIISIKIQVPQSIMWVNYLLVVMLSHKRTV
jgi:hypothetical protein